MHGGELVSYALICVIGMYLLIKYSKVVPDFFGTTIKPLIAAVCCAASAYFTNLFVSGFMPLHLHRVSTIIAIVVAAVVYMAVLLILRTFKAEEIKFLPKGEKIAKTLEKLHLIG